MSVRFTFLFLITCFRAFGQTTLTISVFDDQTRKKIFPVILSLPGTSIPEYTLNETSNIINLSEYRILPGQELTGIKLQKKNYFDYVIPSHIVQSNNSENNISIFMTSKTAVSKGDAWYVRGVVRDSNALLLPNIVVNMADKNFADTTDRYGYYSLKIPKNKVEGISTFKILFTGGKRVKDGYASFKKPATYDYSLDMMLALKNTSDTIIGKLESRKKECSGISAKLIQGSVVYYTTKSDEHGRFTLIVDTAEIDPGKPARLLLSCDGWQDADTTFVIRNQKGIFFITLHPASRFSRSPHEVFVSGRAFPLYADFNATIGYTYHLPALERRMALKAFAGYRYFEKEYEFNTLPDLYQSVPGSEVYFTDTVNQSFQSLIVGAGVTANFRPFDQNTRWNPVAGFNLAFGPKKDFWLIEPTVSAGTMFNMNKQFALTLEAQLSYSQFSHQQPVFKTFSDAEFVKESDHLLRLFIVLSLQFFAAP